MFALPISKPRFKSIIFYQNSPKIVIFAKKMQNFQALGAPLPDPQISTPLRISGDAPKHFDIIWGYHTRREPPKWTPQKSTFLNCLTKVPNVF